MVNINFRKGVTSTGTTGKKSHKNNHDPIKMKSHDEKKQ
jgi:hypothetical protein